MAIVRKVILAYSGNFLNFLKLENLILRLKVLQDLSDYAKRSLPLSGGRTYYFNHYSQNVHLENPCEHQILIAERQ